MRISTAQMYQQGVTNILNKQTEVSRIQSQISTGKRLLTPSDDPAGSAQVLDIAHKTSLTDQFQRNADMATSRLQLEESAISNASDVLARVRELAMQGRSGQFGNQERSYLATEVRQLLEQMASLGNTVDGNNDFLFSGYKAKTQAFTMDSSGTVTYQGDQGTRVLDVSPTHTVADGDPGSNVFMSVRSGNGKFVTAARTANTGTGIISVGSVTNPGAYQPDNFRIVFTSPTSYNILDDTTGSVVAGAQTYNAGSSIAFNGMEMVISGAPAAGDQFTILPSTNQSVFETLRLMAVALETPTSSAASNAQLQNTFNQTVANIDQAQSHFVEVRAAIGARQNVIDAQKSFNDDLNLQLTGLRSSLEDADLVKAASDLNLQLTTLQASQAAFAKMQNLSLFNFL